jgi:hypothetical protein
MEDRKLLLDAKAVFGPEVDDRPEAGGYLDDVIIQENDPTRQRLAVLEGRVPGQDLTPELSSFRIRHEPVADHDRAAGFLNPKQGFGAFPPDKPRPASPEGDNPPKLVLPAELDRRAVFQDRPNLGRGNLFRPGVDIEEVEVRQDRTSIGLRRSRDPERRRPFGEEERARQVDLGDQLLNDGPPGPVLLRLGGGDGGDREKNGPHHKQSRQETFGMRHGPTSLSESDHFLHYNRPFSGCQFRRSS